MSKSFIVALLLVLTWSQLLRPLPVHQRSEVKVVAGAQHDHHAMAEMGHDCCPKLSPKVQIQAPASAPCDEQHRCCMASGEVPALQTATTQFAPDIDFEQPSPNQIVPVTLAVASKIPTDAAPPPSTLSSVLRI